jgi:O-antigen/teichoic acid export membrane protein
MGLIRKQAARSSVGIALGTVIGALNTIIVLPKAFEAFPEGWGLMKVLLAYGLILSQICSFGSSTIFVRFSPKYAGFSLRNLHAFAIFLPTLALLAFALLLAVTGTKTIAWINEEDAYLLQDKLILLWVLTLVLTYALSISGFLGSIFKTIVYQTLNELFLKVAYLIISVGYLFNYYSFEVLLLLYIGTYAVVFVVLALYAFFHGLRLGNPLESPEKPEVLRYGFYAILDKGASIIVNNLDIIMISIMIDLENVAYYTLAFYIGSVVLIPQKALQMIAHPVAAKAIENDDMVQLSEVYRKSALNQLAIGGLIFLGIWVSIKEVFELLPGKFGGGQWVVLFIGLSKMFYLMSGINAGIIVYSSWYRANFVLNVMLLFLTILTNYLLIPVMGVDGAALATAISFLIYNVAKTIFVKQKFGIHPFDKKFGYTLLLLLVISSFGYFVNLGLDSKLATIIIKSSLATGLALFLMLIFRLTPDISDYLLAIRKRWIKR